MSRSTTVTGRLILDDRVAAGRVAIEDGRIATVDLDDAVTGPLIAPGFIDVHVHGWGGHDAMGTEADLDGMARALLRHGVTAFLPTAVTAPPDELAGFARRVRGWIARAARDGAAPLGFNLEGPFISAVRAGAQDPAAIRVPRDVAIAQLEPLLEGLGLITIAPEADGAIELIGRLADRGTVVSAGHSAATLAEGRAGYGAGARSTTHLFNAMTGLDHRAPGLAAAALTDDRVFVELIADGLHVDPGLWPLVVRAKPAGRVVLVSDAVAPAGTGDGPGTLGGRAIEVRGKRCTLRGTDVLAGSVIALDDAVRNFVGAGISLPIAVAAATRNPADLLGLGDRGRIEVGALADLVELGDDLAVARTMHGGRWIAGDATGA